MYKLDRAKLKQLLKSGNTNTKRDALKMLKTLPQTSTETKKKKPKKKKL